MICITFLSSLISTYELLYAFYCLFMFAFYFNALTNDSLRLDNGLKPMRYVSLKTGRSSMLIVCVRYFR